MALDLGVIEQTIKLTVDIQGVEPWKCPRCRQINARWRAACDCEEKPETRTMLEHLEDDANGNTT